MLKAKLLKNPSVIFLICAFILGIIIFCLAQFHLPEIYTNTELAQKAATLDTPQKMEEALTPLINKNFQLHNALFNLFSIFLVLVLICLLYKIKSFKFWESPVLKKPLFAYLWANLTYPIYAIFWTLAYMNNITKYVHHMYADSFSIPLFGTIFTMGYNALVFYPFMNLLLYAFYTKKVFRKRYILLLLLFLLYFSMTAIACFMMAFNYYIPVIYFYILTCVLVLISPVINIKSKRAE